MKSIYFFAVENDLPSILLPVEKNASIKYTLTGNFIKRQLSKGPTTYRTCKEIPNLGRATADQWTGCEAFLVSDLDSKIEARHVKGISENRYCIDQLLNPDTLGFSGGGRWDDNTIISGCIGTASNSKESQRLIKLFITPIKKQFIKVQAFYLGPDAMKAFKSGNRLTGAVQSPREYDLAAH